MACNCATEEQLKELYKTYGEKVDAKLSSNPWQRLKNNVRKFFVYLFVIPIIPLLFLFVIYKVFSDNNKISIRKFFLLRNKNLETNVG